MQSANPCCGFSRVAEGNLTFHTEFIKEGLPKICNAKRSLTIRHPFSVELEGKLGYTLMTEKKPFFRVTLLQNHDLYSYIYNDIRG